MTLRLTSIANSVTHQGFAAQAAKPLTTGRVNIPDKEMTGITITQYRRRAGRASLLLLICMLCACAANEDEEADRPPAADEIKINLLADSDINPNDAGHPAPLNIFIYGLRNRDVFISADFFDIADGSNKTLQAAASKLYEAILQPGEKRAVFIKPDDDMRALGVVAAYRNIDDAIWMSSWEIPQRKRAWWQFFGNDAPEVNARFQKTTVTIKRMD